MLQRSRPRENSVAGNLAVISPDHCIIKSLPLPRSISQAGVTSERDERAAHEAVKTRRAATNGS